MPLILLYKWHALTVLSPEMGSLFESIELRLSIRAAVRCSEFQAVLYAIYAGPYGDYHQCREFA